MAATITPKNPGVEESAWGRNSIRDFLIYTKEGSTGVLKSIFRWEDQEYKEAMDCVRSCMSEQGLDLARLPTKGTMGYKRRETAERTMYNAKPALFRRAHLSPSAETVWYHNGMQFDDVVEPENDAEAEFQTLGQVLILHGNKMKREAGRGRMKQEKKQEALEEHQTRNAQASHAAQKTRHVSVEPVVQPDTPSRRSSASTTQSISRGFKKARLQSEEVIARGEETHAYDETAVPVPISDAALLVSFNRLSKNNNGGLIISIRRVPYTSLLDESGKLDWHTFQIASGFRPETDGFWFFNNNGGHIWSFDDRFTAMGAFSDIRKRLDPASSRVDADIFLSDDPRLIYELPPRMKNASSFGQQVIDVTATMNALQEGSQARRPLAVERGEDDLDDAMPTAQSLEEKEASEAQDERDRAQTAAEEAAALQAANEAERVRQEIDDAEQAEKESQAARKVIDLEAEDKGQPVYKWFIPYDPSKDPYKHVEPATEPSIDLLDCKYEGVEWLSSGMSNEAFEKLQHTEPDIEDEEGAAGTAGTEVTQASTIRRALSLNSALDCTHISPYWWEMNSGFFGLDPKDCHRESGAFFSGWRKQCALTVVQTHAITWSLRTLCQGQNLILLALPMGFGKTATAIAISQIYRYQSARYRDTNGFGPPVPTTSDDETDKNDQPETPFAKRHQNLKWLIGPEYPRPVVRSGVHLIVTPSIGLAWQWKSEYDKFVEKEFRPIIIIGHGSAWSGAFARSMPSAFHWQGMIPRNLCPTAERLRAGGYSDKEIALLEKDDGMLVRVLLRPRKVVDEDGETHFEPQPWHSRFVIITTKDSLRNVIEPDLNKTFGGTKDRQPIQAIFGMLIVDESHLTKSITASPFDVISRLESDPAIVALSATMFNKPSDLYGIVHAAESKYFHVHKKHVWAMSAASFCEEQARGTLQYSPRLDEDQQSILDERYWCAVADHVTHLDRFVAGRTLTSKQAWSKRDRTEADEALMKKSTAVNKWLNRFCIKFDASTIWKTDVNSKGMPAQSVPPHAAWDLSVQIPDVYVDLLSDHWNEGLHSSDAGSKMVVLTVAHEFRTHILFPSLYQWTLEDEELRDALGGMKIENAKAVSNGIHDDVLDEYLPRLFELKSMQLLFHMITQFRSQKNFFGYPRKIAVVAHKPMNLAILHKIFCYAAQLDEYQTITSEDDFVVIESYHSELCPTNAVAAEHLRMFKTTNPQLKGYQDKPFLLLAVVSQIMTGVNLPPADVVVTVDGCWISSQDEQVSGRVQRSRKVQKAERTESYRFTCVSEDPSRLPLGTWQQERHMDQSRMRKLLLASSHPTDDD